MSLVKEFKEFAMRGNVVDMAVGIVIGGAFGKIVGSFVGDVIMPLVGQLTGGVDLSRLFFAFGDESYDTLAAAREAGAVTVAYGAFMNTVIDFVIIAFAIFMAIKAMNALKRKEDKAPAAPTAKKCPECVMEIPIEAKRCGHCTAAIAG